MTQIGSSTFRPIYDPYDGGKTSGDQDSRLTLAEQDDFYSADLKQAQPGTVEQPADYDTDTCRGTFGCPTTIITDACHDTFRCLTASRYCNDSMTCGGNIGK